MYSEKRNFRYWRIPNFNPDKKLHRKVIVAFDCEYVSGVKKAIPIGGRSQDVNQRRLEDIISIQLAFNFENSQPVQWFIQRDPTDPPFMFYDVMKLLKEYLVDIGVYTGLKKKKKIFTVELWTFWGGVDLTAFADWEKILTENDPSSTSKLVTIHSNTVFSEQPLMLIVKNRHRHEYNLFPDVRLTMRDMTKLAPGKFNLEKLGNLVKVPKLDTERWDLDDGKPRGYYKSHMLELWKKRQQDFIDYAMRDTVITALYGAFMLRFQDKLEQDGLGEFQFVSLKPSLGSIVANVVGVRNMSSARWIVDLVYDDLKEIGGKRQDVERFLRGICRGEYVEDPETKKKTFDFRFDELFQKNRNEQSIKWWLGQYLDFDLIRKGYLFPSKDVTDDKHHKHLANDITNRIDAPLARLFDDAVKAYIGGYNVVHIPGVLPKGGFKRDYDLKSAYNTAGHLIPDIAPALGTMDNITNCPIENFSRIVEWCEELNGAYTVGVGVFDITYPENYQGFTITPQSVDDGPRYFKELKAVTLSYTDAYTAWLCGAKVFTHRLDFPQQPKMHARRQQDVAQEGVVQDIFQQRRSHYTNKNHPLNILNKNVGNQAYGVTGEGLKEKRSRDFNDGKPYYIPFSRITNPLKAMQFTAITRLHIVLLQQSIWNVDPNAIFLNNVTDGCLVWSDKKLNPKKITEAMENLADYRYRGVVKKYFNGDYFEEKDGTDDEVANLRTRLTFSRDGALNAMVGINASKLSPQAVFDQYLDIEKNKIPVENRVITGLTDMRHQKKFDHLQTSWLEETDLFLGYDFAQWPTEYEVAGKFIYWKTRPYQDVREFQELQWFGRELIRYGAIYSADDAPFYRQTLEEFRSGKSPKLFGEYVKKEIAEKPVLKGNEVYYNWSLYVARYALDIAEAYQVIVDLFDLKGFIFYKGGIASTMPSFETFKTYIYRNRKGSKYLINYVLLHNLSLI